LTVIEPQRFAMNLLQNPDFLLEVFDHGLLLAIDPARQAKESKR
jgi:hypothetical protein